jgi:hypothetical protein
MREETHQCRCGRRYRLTAVRVVMRDKDRIHCRCGQKIKEWNEAKIWSADEITAEDNRRACRAAS